MAYGGGEPEKELSALFHYDHSPVPASIMAVWETEEGRGNKALIAQRLGILVPNPNPQIVLEALQLID